MASYAAELKQGRWLVANHRQRDWLRRNRRGKLQKRKTKKEKQTKHYVVLGVRVASRV
jgi:hypothetical protein